MPDFHTGRYALYIWPAYGLTVLVLGWMITGTLIRARHWKKRAEGKDQDRP